MHVPPFPSPGRPLARLFATRRAGEQVLIASKTKREPKKVSIAVVLDTGGKTLEELVNFPMIDDQPPSSPAPESEEVGGKVCWTDESITQDDADPNGAELP